MFAVSEVRHSAVAQVSPQSTAYTGIAEGTLGVWARSLGDSTPPSKLQTQREFLWRLSCGGSQTQRRHRLREGCAQGIFFQRRRVEEQNGIWLTHLFRFAEVESKAALQDSSFSDGGEAEPSFSAWQTQRPRIGKRRLECFLIPERRGC